MMQIPVEKPILVEPIRTARLLSLDLWFYIALDSVLRSSGCYCVGKMQSTERRICSKETWLHYWLVLFTLSVISYGIRTINSGVQFTL